MQCLKFTNLVSLPIKLPWRLLKTVITNHFKSSYVLNIAGLLAERLPGCLASIWQDRQLLDVEARVGKGLRRGGDEGRQEKNRAGPEQDCLFMKWFLLSSRSERARPPIVLSLMNNMNECEKERKCKEQRRLQTRRINAKTKTVCPQSI